jgi:RHS repeat-associated protein
LHGRGEAKAPLTNYGNGDGVTGSSLSYSSSTVGGKIITGLSFSSISGESTERLVVRSSLQWGSFSIEQPGTTGIDGLKGGEQFWALPSTPTTVQVAVESNVEHLPTGTYSSMIESGIVRAANGGYYGSTFASSTDVTVVNRPAGPFGAGWSLNGLNQLSTNADGSVLLSTGAGSVRQYMPPAGAGLPYQSENDDPSTFTKLADGTFQRSFPDGVVHHFNAAGMIDTATDSNGNAVHYLYDAANRLTQLQDRFGQMTTFNYTGGRVTSVIDPYERVTSLSYDADGNLMSINDPAGGVLGYSYDAAHDLTRVVDKVNHATTLEYGPGGRVSRMVFADGTADSFAPGILQGLPTAGATLNPATAPLAPTSKPSQATITDAAGHLTTYFLDSMGSVISSTDEIGPSGTTLRDAQNNITASTDALGHVTINAYDAVRNLLGSRDEVSAATGVLSGTTAANEGRAYSFNGTTGELLFVSASAPGSPSIQLVPPGSAPPIDLGLGDHVVRLPGDGSYRLTYSNTAAGTFRIAVLDTSTGLAIAPGAFVSTALSAKIGSDVYLLSVPAGQRLVLDITGGAAITKTLYDAAGDPVSFDSAFSSPTAGTYVLVVGLSGSPASPVNYTLSYTQPPTHSVALTLGATTTFAPRQTGEQTDYTFAGTVGQVLILDGLYQNDGSGPGVRLLSPTGVEVFTAGSSPDFGPVTLYEAGTYTLEMTEKTVGDFRFRLIDTTAALAITLGTDMGGVLSDGTQTDVYRLQGTAGQQVLFHPVSVTGTSFLYWEMRGPGGSTIASGQFSSDSRATFPIDGTYLLIVRQLQYTGGDSFAFRVTDVSETPVAASGFGVVRSGTIAAGQFADFTYTAPAGLPIYIDSQSPSATALTMQFLDPTGADALTHGSSIPLPATGDVLPTTLPRSGTYTLRIKGVSANSTGTFKIRVLDLTTDSVAAPLGTTISGTVNPNEAVVYRFDATLGHALVQDGLTDEFGAVGLQVLPRGVDNVYISNDGFANNDGLPVVPITGQQYAIVTTRNTIFGPTTTPQTYNFRFLDTTTAAAISLNAPVNDSVAANQSINVYSFTGTAGLRIAPETLSGTVGFGLYEPGGKLLQGPDQVELDATLPADGQYLLVAEVPVNNATVNYSFRIDTPTTSTTALAFDTVISGNLSVPADRNQYTFTGTKGGIINVEEFSGPQLLGATLTGPDGQPASVNLDGATTLTQSGPYTLTLSGAAGSYQVRVRDVTGMHMITPETTVNGAIDPGNGMDVYAFTATAGQRFDFETLSLSVPFVTSWQVTGPGTPGQSTAIDGGYYFEADQDGTYLLTAMRSSAGGPVTYSFKMHIAPTNVAPLSFGGTLSGAITRYQRDDYTFAGTVGQRLYFDGQSTSNNGLAVQIIDSTGASVGDFGPNDDGALHPLPSTGSYTMRVETAQIPLPDNAAYSVRLIDLATATPLQLGATSGSINPRLQATTYRFTGAVGKKIHFENVSATPASDAMWGLVGTDGNYLTGQNYPIDQAFDVVLPATGDYYLIFGTQSSGPAVDFSFTAADVSDAPVSPSGFGVEHTGSVPAGQSQSFTFAGSQGQFILLNQFDGNSNISYSIQDPSSNDVPSLFGLNSDFLYRLPNSGTYTVTINNFSASPQPFAFQVLNPTDPAAALTLGNTVTGSLPAPNHSAVYSFSGAVGQQVFLDTLDVGVTPFSYHIYTPNGAELSTGAPLTLTESGTYIVHLNGSNSAAAGYQFRVLDLAAAAQSMPATGLVSGTLNPGTSAKIFSVVAPAGPFSITGVSGFDMNTQLALVGSGGQVPVATANLGGDATWTLPADGSYYLVVRESGAGANPIPFQFRTTANVPIPALPIQVPGGPVGRTRYTYDSKFNRVTSAIDELGRTTLFDIDPANGNVRSVTRVVGAVGGADDVTTHYTYNARGQTATITDPLGRTTHYEYNAAGRLTKVTLAEGTPDQGVATYEYDVAGNLSASTDPNGQRTTYNYDAVGRLTRITQPDPDGAGPLPAPVTVFSYDLAGNLLSSTDALGHVVSREYDALGRLTKVTDASGSAVTTYDADGLPISVTDPLGHKTTTQYDARYQVTAVTDPSNNTIHYAYDASGNLLSFKDADGNETDYVYDARGRVVKETDPLLKSMFYSFDTTNQLTSSTDRLGRTIVYTYDDLGRVVSQTWVGGNYTGTFSYDAAGQLISASDPFSQLAFTYDNRGRLVSTDNAGTPGTPHVALTAAHDPVGNRTSLTDSINGTTGATNTYQYDALNRMTRVTQSGNGVSAKRVDIGYNPLGQFDTLTRYADIAGTQPVATTNYTYDSDNRLTGITHKNAGGTTLAFEALTYNANSLITQAVDGDGTTNYTYDAAGQLTGASHTDPANPAETYAYDANGNRTATATQPTGYTTGPGNRLLSDGTYNYVYDNSGNTIRRTNIATGAVREFQWDYRNLLTAVIDKTSGGTETQRVEFTYDVLGRRIGKAVAIGGSTTSTSFVYDGSDVVLEFSDSDGPTGPAAPVLAERYLHGPAVDQVFAQDNGAGDVRWLLSNHLGSTTDVLDAAGAVIDHIKYDSYGNIISQTDVTRSSRYLFTGREFDAETGLYYYRARYYTASNGRFMSEDPLGSTSGDVNFFRYVNNSPVSNTDRYGLTSWWDIVQSILGQGFDANAHGASLPGLIDAISGLAQSAASFAKKYNKRLPGDKCGPASKQEQGQAENALRHAFWQAALTALYGPVTAKAIGDAHENPIDQNDPLQATDSAVDKFNNERGREIGERIGQELRDESFLHQVYRDQVLDRVEHAVLDAYDHGLLNLHTPLGG